MIKYFVFEKDLGEFPLEESPLPILPDQILPSEFSPVNSPLVNSLHRELTGGNSPVGNLIVGILKGEKNMI